VMAPLRQVSNAVWRSHGIQDGRRAIPEEIAVAFTYEGTSHAVMMATPQDLEDFAVGFSLHEGVITAPEKSRDLEITEHDAGIELRIWVGDMRAIAFGERRRRVAGPSGLCGIESLADAMRAPSKVREGRSVTPGEVMRALSPSQTLNCETRAVHAAAFFDPDPGLVALREDVGRHNALGGALARSGTLGHTGMVLTSRVSIEMVQKGAVIGAPVMVAMSAPTAIAVRAAEVARITLLAIARRVGFEIFSHPHRILSGADRLVSIVTDTRALAARDEDPRSEVAQPRQVAMSSAALLTQPTVRRRDAKTIRPLTAGRALGHRLVSDESQLANRKPDRTP
jgi:FdhD protein